jgi:hypothetical protein
VKVLPHGERHDEPARAAQRQVPLLLWHGEHGPVDRGDGDVHLLAAELVGDLEFQFLGKLLADQGGVLVLGIELLHALVVERG